MYLFLAARCLRVARAGWPRSKHKNTWARTHFFRAASQNRKLTYAGVAVGTPQPPSKKTPGRVQMFFARPPGTAQLGRRGTQQKKTGRVSSLTQAGPLGRRGHPAKKKKKTRRVCVFARGLPEPLTHPHTHQTKYGYRTKKHRFLLEPKVHKEGSLWAV